MKSWKSKLFGDNRLNFYGWICTGLLIIGLSLLLMIQAIVLGAFHSASDCVLAAIWVLLLGLLGLSLQNYCARVARAIEDEEAKR